MFRETIVAIATAAVVGLGAMALSSSPASAYDGDYERYCYYHRYDPACWRYWHRDYDEATTTSIITIIMTMITTMIMTTITTITTIMITIMTMSTTTMITTDRCR
jgi:hypothetical protein